MGQIISTPTLSFSEALDVSTSKIAQFTGRSRRSEYWWTIALVCLINIFLTPIIGFLADFAIIPLTFRRLHDTNRSGWWYGIYVLFKFMFIICLFYDLVMMAIHANEINGYEDDVIFVVAIKYLIWIGAIFVYRIILLIFMCLDSDKERNNYGESPKYIEPLEEQNGK